MHQARGSYSIGDLTRMRRWPLHATCKVHLHADEANNAPRFGPVEEPTSSASAPRARMLTVWMSLWRAQMILPAASMLATGSSRPILIMTAPSSKPIATLRQLKIRSGSRSHATGSGVDSCNPSTPKTIARHESCVGYIWQEVMWGPICQATHKLASQQ